MTASEIQTLLQELDECSKAIACATHQVTRENRRGALAVLTDLAEVVERLRHALDNPTCRAAVCAEIKARIR